MGSDFDDLEDFFEDHALAIAVIGFVFLLLFFGIFIGGE